jgi:hypothetical protein
MEGTHSLFYEKQDTKFLRRRLRFAKHLQIPWLSLVTGAMQAWPQEKTRCLFHFSPQDPPTTQRVLGSHWFLPNLDP